MSNASKTVRRTSRGGPGTLFLRGRTVAYGSALERDWMIALDFDPRCQCILEQPFTVPFAGPTRTLKYTPHIKATFLELGREWVEVYEVKPAKILRQDWAKWKPRFKAAIRHCRQQGWSFWIITERDLDTQFVDNAKFLRRYRTIPLDPLHHYALLHYLEILGPTDPQTLIATCWGDKENQAAAMVELWRMVAFGHIQTWLNRPLTLYSEIWLP